MVAIKTILAKTESPCGHESRERFRREARSAGNLSHPNIVTIHDFSDSGDPMFIAMEFVEGQTLAEAMSKGPLPLDFTLGVLRSAADALDYAHGQHIVHRDIKPANFLINKNGRLKITDFGIAKILDSDEGLTSTGMLVGTAQYMSPEQVSEAHVTGRSDQFSLAVIAYEMLTGVKPFQGNSWATVIHAIIMAEPPHITKYRDSLGETVNTVLRKALSKDPQRRYATCSEFCDALERGIIGETADRTAIFAKTQSTPPQAPLVEHKTVQVLNAQAGPSAIHEPPPQVVKNGSRYIQIGCAGGAVVAAGLWLGLRGRTTQSAAPVAVQQPNASRLSEPPAPASQPSPALRNEPTPAPRAAENSASRTPKQVKEKSPAEPVPAVQPPHPIEKTIAVETTPTTAPPPAPTTPPVQRDPTPSPQPTVAPARTPDDQSKRLAEEQQAKRAADEQAKRAADDQARRLVEEQARNARTAENLAISSALKDYQAAYEHKDLGALQAIWPSIPKQVLEGIRGSFRDASEVSMDLRPLSEPKVSGTTATVVCDRNLRQVILKRVLQASSRVRIVLIRSGAGWTIQSVDPVNE